MNVLTIKFEVVIQLLPRATVYNLCQPVNTWKDCPVYHICLGEIPVQRNSTDQALARLCSEIPSAQRC